MSLKKIVLNSGLVNIEMKYEVTLENPIVNNVVLIVMWS